MENLIIVMAFISFLIFKQEMSEQCLYVNLFIFFFFGKFKKNNMYYLQNLILLKILQKESFKKKIDSNFNFKMISIPFLIYLVNKTVLTRNEH